MPRPRLILRSTSSGQPQLQVSGRDGLLSARAVAGEAELDSRSSSPTPAPRRPRTSNSRRSAPTGWKVTFEPATIDRLVPGKDAEVQALVTPSEKSLAGDYMTSVSAASRGENASSQFRITVVDLDGVGNGRRRRHRRCAAPDAGRGREVRTPMSDSESEASHGQRYRHRGARPHQALRRESASSTPSTSTSSRARCSDCSGRTAPARRPRS